MRLFIVGLILLTAAGCATGRQSVSFTDHGRAVSNPGMGWNFAYYSNNTNDFVTTLHEGDYLDWFPVDMILFRLGWSHLEPEEGVYNWEFTDRIARDWVKHGKRVGFCWVVCYPGFQDTPLWVRDAGAEGVEYNLFEECEKRGFDPGMPWFPVPDTYGTTWVPNYDDPVFLEKFSSFLAAAAERYDGKEWVEFIEIGSVGSWGEGHDHMSWPARVSDEIRKDHVKLWTDHFKKTQVFVNDDYHAGALLGRDLGCGMADHSVQVEGRSGNTEMAERFWREQPVSLECHYGVEPKELYYQSLEDCHASYMRLHSSPYTAWEMSSNVIQRINQRMGYRFQVVQAVFPDETGAGSVLPVELALRNGGVAPCYGLRVPTLWLRNVLTGAEYRTTDTGFDLGQLPPGPSADDAAVVDFKAAWKLPADLAKGEYELLFSVGDADGTPQINLPYDEVDEHKRLVMGRMAVK